VIRTIKSFEESWSNTWQADMFRPGNRIHVVQGSGNCAGVYLEDGYRYPATCLERIDAQMIDCTIQEET
jgi:hypothetical protein